MGKLTHLEAFMSDDAKRGRVWTDSEFLTEYRRLRDVLQCRVPGQNNLWFNSESQVVTKLGDCRWADEPKTLTPQEALRALADGKVLIDKDLLWKLGGDGCIYTKHGSAPWEECPSQSFNDWHVVPDPSQPAEPARPPLKVGDRVKDTRVRSRSGTVVGPCNDDRLVKVNYDDIGVINGSQVEYLEKIEAEPQVEYPLTFEDACLAAKRGALVTNERYPYVTYGIINGVRQVRSETKGWRGDDWGYSQTERGARWRIVDGGK